VTSKGQLEEMGFQRSSTFVNDVQYREGRQFRKTRDRRAIERMSTYGKRLLQDRWTGHEQNVMWFIDFPQAIDLAANLQGLDFLHRDVVNVCTWFRRRGLDVDAQEVFADLLTVI
jgi:hypothetical protein